MNRVKYPLAKTVLDRATKAAKVVGLPIEDLARIGLVKACEEIESTGQILVKVSEKRGAK